MNRFKKYLATAALLVLPILAACGEDVIPPPATGSIAGQVSIEGTGADGVSVNLSNGASTTTAGGGNYRFDGVEAGSYTVTISGFPADASFGATSASVTIPENGGSVTHNFQGSYIRTASVMGSVTVEGVGLGGATVRLSGMADSQTATDMSGQYAFTGLRAGTYSVVISGFDTNEVAFGATTSAATVGVGESKIVSFDGTYLRTAGISGQVTVEGDGLQGVTVSLSGVEQRTMTTDAGGQYAFAKLKAGDYAVAISGYDTDDYEFAQTSKSVTIATGETATVPFDGTLLRTAGISGRVSVEGTGLDGVGVTLAGAAGAMSTTSGGGQYSFAGLAAGTYVVSFSNPDEDAYSFDMTQATIALGDSESKIQNFEGTHTRTASVSGMAYIDEAPADKMYTANEPALMHAGLPIALQGPGVNDVQVGVTGADGSYAFEGLRAGAYRVLVNLNEAAATDLATGGFAFVGDLTGQTVTVGAGMSSRVNFPFRITTQTINVGAVMGNDDETGDPVKGVELGVYPTANDAEDRTNMLGEAVMTGDDGMAAFDFARADDSGPGGADTDHLVFVRVIKTGHDDLAVHDNDVIEVEYASTARMHDAPASVRLLNTAVNFQFWVKSDMDARDGNQGLGGWHTEVMMGKDTGPLTMVNATMPTAMDNKDLGKASFSYMVDADDLADGPATFSVSAAATGQPDMGEKWMQSDALEHSHDGLMLPDNMANDLGPVYVTFTTQSLTVGVHREMDDREGFTDYIGVGDGDQRPMGHADKMVEVSLMTLDSRGRPRIYEYDHDAKASTDDIKATMTFPRRTGMVTFKNVPAADEIIAVVRAPSGIVTVPSDRYSMELDVYGAHMPDGGRGRRRVRRGKRSASGRVVVPADGRRRGRHEGLLDLRLQVGRREGVGQHHRRAARQDREGEGEARPGRQPL